MESKYINRYHTYCKCLENLEKSKNADPNADITEFLQEKGIEISA